MEPEARKRSPAHKLKRLLIGSERSIEDSSIFHKLTLIAFFAWIGLGADGLSSSCYGPEEAFLALGKYDHLIIFVALATIITVFTISASYSQIIELFPSGGGGYLVASKLLSPAAGMVSGCALLIDYALTIAISVASGADAFFSFLPASWHPLKLQFALAGVMLLTVLNLRGVKESVLPLAPIFLIFVATHGYAVVHALITNIPHLSGVIASTGAEMEKARAEIGLAGTLFLILRAYSMGAGTYTGLEAVSNGLPILREPRVQTGKRTMRYMAVSLSVLVLGLMTAYLLYRVAPSPGKTLNAALFEGITHDWGSAGSLFVQVTLLSEAALLFVAAQTGFLDGPRVLANMALDRWFPTKFAMLSDRLVAQKGILLMGGAALATMALTTGRVKYLVVLYSINVFITFFLSQLGMVRHWWQVRAGERGWRRKLLINGVGLVLTSCILASVTVIKFHEGGWITLLLTGVLVTVAVFTRRHYRNTLRLLDRLDELVALTRLPDRGEHGGRESGPACDRQARTAVLLVNGFNGLGLHTLLSVIRLFGGMYRNFVFVEVGVLDAGTFKGAEEIARLKEVVKKDLDRYVDYLKRHGYYAEGFAAFGTDVVDEIDNLAPKILDRFPEAVFFGGQLVFPTPSAFSGIFHNYTIFAVQRRFYGRGIPVIILPIRV